MLIIILSRHPQKEKKKHTEKCIGLFFLLSPFLQVKPRLLLSFISSYSSPVDMMLRVSEAENMKITHVEQQILRGICRLASSGYGKPRSSPFKVQPLSVAHRGFICPICCLTQVEELAVKKEIPFSLLCSFTVAASGLQRVSDTRTTFTFPSLRFFPLCQLWICWEIKPVTGMSCLLIFPG